MHEDDSGDTVILPSCSATLSPEVSDAQAPDEDTIIVAQRRALPPETTPSRAAERAEPAADVVIGVAPTPYRIRVGDQVPIPLTVPVYIGRNPRSPRITTGAGPRLIPAPSPQREVSNTHVEIRQHGLSVIVTDLGSTNGTIVNTPGSARLRLRQGESVVVIPGTVVDIGDGNRIEILPTQRFS